MAGELAGALSKRQSVVEGHGEVWESLPVRSAADASHFEGVTFGEAPSVTEWIARLNDAAEEDPMREAFADLLKTRGPLPAHVPRHAIEHDRLQKLTSNLVDLRAGMQAESNDLGQRSEELARREAALALREKAHAAAVEGGPRHYPQPAWLHNVEGTMNVAVVGNSGVGKSLLINRLRRMRRGSGLWAPTGVKETTKEPTMYALPGDERVRLWDLPGAGTEGFPLETYIQVMGLRYFDSVLIVTANRFTVTEVELRNELEAYHVPFLMVRTKVDIDGWNNMQDNGMTVEQTLQLIRNELRLHHGIDHAYLVSSRDPESELYDMKKLLFDAFPGLKKHFDKQSLVFSPNEKSGWGDAWSLPNAHSEILAGIQGNWHDRQDGTRYTIDGSQVHVTLPDGRAAILPLTERKGKVVFQNGWSITVESVANARSSSELRWAPHDLRCKPLVWWWMS